jgi:hypothetical protein
MEVFIAPIQPIGTKVFNSYAKKRDGTPLKRSISWVNLLVFSDFYKFTSLSRGFSPQLSLEEKAFFWDFMGELGTDSNLSNLFLLEKPEKRESFSCPGEA